MRVVVISRQPALALALGTQIPGCDARSADKVEAVLQLIEDGGVVLIDVGSGEEADRWIADLEHVGLVHRSVVIDDGDAPAREGGEQLAVRLHRPFSFAELAMALEQVAARPGTEAEAETDAATDAETESAKEARTATSVETEPATTSEPQAEHLSAPRNEVQPGVATPGPEPRPASWLQAPPPPPAEASEALFDGHASTEEGEAVALAPDPSDAPVPSTSPSQTIERPGFLARLFSSRRGDGSAEAPALPRNLDDLPRRIEEGARSLQHVGALAGELPSLGDPHRCAELVLEEVAAQVKVGGAAVLLRTDDHHLEIAASTREHGGAALGQVALPHPYIQAVDRRGGALLLDPTDEVRGLLAGIPVSSWQALHGVLVTSDGSVDALVLVGQPGPGAPAELDRLYDTVHGAAAVLRFAAAYSRLPRADAGPSAFLRSWMSAP